MKLKLDENLPESLLTERATLNHDVDTVRQEGPLSRTGPPKIACRFNARWRTPRNKSRRDG